MSKLRRWCGKQPDTQNIPKKYEGHYNENRVFTKVQGIPNIESIGLFFVKKRRRVDTETSTRGSYVMDYKIWRGKMYILNMEFKRYENETKKS